ncbi:hypothetical protein BJ322DRAFT_1017291 [Thelephora terrestris]|uniref:Uncharacterized protein n=1 Tax=Thelephora terrestris TaxID=56493 RepID=A0A9P6HQC2_9AGAM|nr:hypothetical protein BJ322DRAFT_1017291 [Thelephora terrestris]
MYKENEPAAKPSFFYVRISSAETIAKDGESRHPRQTPVSTSTWYPRRLRVQLHDKDTKVLALQESEGQSVHQKRRVPTVERLCVTAAPRPDILLELEELSDFGLATDLHWAHDTAYYEQQRLHLLHKHGVDIEDMNGFQDGMRTRRMNRKDIESLMGGGDGEGGIFTRREKHGRKLAYSRQSVAPTHTCHQRLFAATVTRFHVIGGP